MAEPCNKAFGRYLRILRERRDLSLDDVQSLSQAFADPVNKGYLSRCENGFQLPSISKLIPLSRIYEVPTDVLTERMELDMELDRVGGPETAGLTFERLRDEAQQAARKGASWHQYAYYRDAIPRALLDPPLAHFRDLVDQLHVALMNCAIAASKLHRHRYPLHEYSFLLLSNAVTPRSVVVLKERTSLCYRELGDLVHSQQMAEAAISDAVALDDADLLGLTHSNRAILASKVNDHQTAIKYYQDAFTFYRRAGLQHACVRTLNNIAQVYFDLGRYDGAKRSLAAARKLALAGQQRRVLALGRILLGEIDILEGRGDFAREHLTEAVTIAKDLNDRVLRFKAEFQLFRLAGRVGDVTTQRTLARRLRRLQAWLPQQVPELTEFLSMVH